MERMLEITLDYLLTEG